MLYIYVYIYILGAGNAIKHLKLLYILGGNAKQFSNSGKHRPVSKTLNIYLNHPDIQLLEIYPRELKSCIHKNLGTKFL